MRVLIHPLMPSARRQARILAMQMLCQLEVRGDEALEDAAGFFADESAPVRVARHADALVRACWNDRAELDRRVTAASPDWRMERISTVERNIIRVAVTEMLGSDVPPRVALNEAIEIGKTFGGTHTPRFINGVLNAVYQRILEETGG